MSKKDLLFQTVMGKDLYDSLSANISANLGLESGKDSFSKLGIYGKAFVYAYSIMEIVTTKVDNLRVRREYSRDRVLKGILLLQEAGTTLLAGVFLIMSLIVVGLPGLFIAAYHAGNNAMRKPDMLGSARSAVNKRIASHETMLMGIIDYKVDEICKSPLAEKLGLKPKFGIGANPHSSTKSVRNKTGEMSRPPGARRGATKNKKGPSLGRSGKKK